MNTLEALVQAVLLDPTDDVPRLAVADYLEEVGEPIDLQNAAFIRDHLAGLWPDPDVFHGHYRELLLSLDAPLCELFGLGPIGWIDDPPLPALMTRWERGFLGALGCMPNAFITHAPALFAAYPITEVRLLGRRPVREINGWRWKPANQRATVLHPLSGPARLPIPLYARLMHGPGHHTSWYATQEQAQAALSRACVDYGRWVAGLPPLDFFRPSLLQQEG